MSKKKLQTMFAITHGCYSDYTVDAICDDKATAELWAAEMRKDKEFTRDDTTVEEMVFIPKGAKPYYVTRWWQNVELWDDGKTETRGPQSQTYLAVGSYYGIPARRPRIRYVRAPCHNNRGGRLEVEASSREAVVKAVADRMRMWKAGSWAGPNHPEIIEGIKQ